MILRMRGLYGLARTPVRCHVWQRIQVPHRSFASANPGSGSTSNSQTNATTPEWFEKLRAEMLARELPWKRETLQEEVLHKLGATLNSYFPSSWQRSSKTMPAGIGEHTFFFNPALPDHELLPDGTDQLHSPGGIFVRRMWAGGSLTVANEMWHEQYGWNGRHQEVLCSERITDVQLRGSENQEKIFVTIERRVAADHCSTNKISSSKQALHMTRNPELVEIRNIVFLRAHSQEELEAIEQGDLKPVKYLRAPESPDFSHILTPTHTLLSRFSALTFNAHRIHLDREYARDVEGHRNILVHGPLTLTLILKFIGTHISNLQSGPHYVREIQYRNLAPLYCDEQLRLCAKQKGNTLTDDIKEYDVWIEGPTGGMAFKGVVRLSRLPGAKPKSQLTDSDERGVLDKQPDGTARLTQKLHPDSAAPVDGMVARTESDTPHRTSTVHRITSTNAIPQTPSVGINTASGRRYYGQSSRHRGQDDSGRQLLPSPFSLPDPQRASSNEHAPSGSDGPPINNSNPIRIIPTDRPTRLHPTMSLASRNLLRRTLRRRNMTPDSYPHVDPIPLIRYHNRNPEREVANSRFSRGGVRLLTVDKATTRFVHPRESPVVDRKVYDEGGRWRGKPRKINTDRVFSMGPRGKSAGKENDVEDSDPVPRHKWRRIKIEDAEKRRDPPKSGM